MGAYFYCSEFPESALPRNARAIVYREGTVIFTLYHVEESRRFVSFTCD